MTTDPGLQPERTVLARHRTAVAAAGCAALLLHVAARHGWTITAVLPAVLVAASAAVLAGCGRVSRTAIRPVALGAVGLLVTSAAVSGLPLVLSGR